MTKPDWFILAEQWLPRNMGRHGVTLPFLVGAIAHKAGQTDIGVDQVHKILDDIVRHLVEGYFTEVSWCSSILAPVINVKKIDSQDRMPPKATIPRPSGGGESIVFSMSLTFQWDSKNAQALLVRLLKDAAEPVRRGCYSRNSKYGTVDFEYGDFTPKERKYIEDTIMQG